VFTGAVRAVDVHFTNRQPIPWFAGWWSRFICGIYPPLHDFWTVITNPLYIVATLNVLSLILFFAAAGDPVQRGDIDKQLKNQNFEAGVFLSYFSYVALIYFTYVVFKTQRKEAYGPVLLLLALQFCVFVSGSAGVAKLVQGPCKQPPLKILIPQPRSAYLCSTYNASIHNWIPLPTAAAPDDAPYIPCTSEYPHMCLPVPFGAGWAFGICLMLTLCVIWVIWYRSINEEFVVEKQYAMITLHGSYKDQFPLYVVLAAEDAVRFEHAFYRVQAQLPPMVKTSCDLAQGHF
jgi:hypothetical protein